LRQASVGSVNAKRSNTEPKPSSSATLSTLSVKTGKARTEQMFSGLPPKADLRWARL
jgi:hypothetical protein